MDRNVFTRSDIIDKTRIEYLLKSSLLCVPFSSKLSHILLYITFNNVQNRRKAKDLSTITELSTQYTNYDKEIPGNLERMQCKKCAKIIIPNVNGTMKMSKKVINFIQE